MTAQMADVLGAMRDDPALLFDPRSNPRQGTYSWFYMPIIAAKIDSYSVTLGRRAGPAWFAAHCHRDGPFVPLSARLLAWWNAHFGNFNRLTFAQLVQRGVGALGRLPDDDINVDRREFDVVKQ